MAGTETEVKVRVGDEVWIATALLHRENPEREDFTVQEIVERAGRENITGTMRPGVSVHAYKHCVANLPPNPATYRMLTSTGKSRRRLFRPGDDSHPARSGKTTPRPDQIPERYHELIDWYEHDYARESSGGVTQENDPVLAMRGVGAEIWRDEDPDEYVRRLREDWE